MERYIRYNISNIDMNPEVLGRPPLLEKWDIRVFDRAAAIVNDFNAAGAPDFSSVKDSAFWVGTRINVYAFADGGVLEENVAFGLFAGACVPPTQKHRDEFNLNFDERMLPFHASLFVEPLLKVSHYPDLMKQHGKIPEWDTAWLNVRDKILEKVPTSEKFGIAKSLGTSYFLIDQGKEHIAVFSKTLGGAYIRQTRLELLMICPAGKEAWFYRLWRVSASGENKILA